MGNSLFFPKKRDILYDTAISATKSIAKLIKLSGGLFSSKYTHGYDDKCKFIQVLKGVVYEEKTGLKIFKGDKIKVSPSDNYTPYTEAEEAYLRVCVGDCKSLFEQVCT